MNTQSIKHNIEIIANVGVLLGIILLAYEVNQNNELLAAEARTTTMLIRGNNVNELSRDSDLLAIRFKANRNEELTEIEDAQLHYDMVARIVYWEWEYEQQLAGRIENVPVNAWLDHMTRWPYQVRYWQNTNATFTSHFRAFMEENIISQLEE